MRMFVIRECVCLYVVHIFIAATVGPAVFVTTHEAAPLNQPAPALVSLAPDVVSVSWSPPLSPNGLIHGYTVYRRLADSTAYTVHIGDNITFSFINAGPGKPTTQRKYLA